MTYALKDKFSASADGDPAFRAFILGDQAALLKQEYHEKHSGPDSHDEQTAEDDAEDFREQLLDILNGIGQAVSFVYDNPELSEYAGFTNSNQWQEFADKKIDDWSAAAGTTVIVSPEGKVYYGVTNADGNQEYYKINENGSTTRVFDTNQDLQDTPEGAETFDALAVGAGSTLYKQVNERGETEYVNRQGEKIDDATVQQAKEALAKVGRTLEGSTGSYEEWENAKLAMSSVYEAEMGVSDAQDSLKAADSKLAQNYTPEHFIDREMKKIELLQAGIDAKRSGSTALSQEEDNKILEHETKLAEDRQKLEKIQSGISGKSPEEANKIMTATFGDKYDTKLAQQAIGLKQQAAEIPAVFESTISTRSGLQTTVNMRADFGNAAGGEGTTIPAQKPVPLAPAQPPQQFSLS